MKEERLMILNMVNEGKITADDAAKLLSTLAETATTEKRTYDNTWDEWDANEAQERLSKFSQAVDSFAKDFGDKMNAAFKDVEPKLKKTARTIVEKTASVVDELSRSLNENLKNMSDNDCCEEEEENCCCEDKDDEPKEN